VFHEASLKIENERLDSHFTNSIWTELFDSGICFFLWSLLKVEIKVEKIVPEMPEAVSYKLELEFGWIQLFSF